MLNNLKKKRKGKGFTLIELIIVIAIIAIIATIAIPKLLNSRDQANRKSDIANAKTIANTASSLLANDELDVPATGVASSRVVENPNAEDPDTNVYTNGNDIAVGLQSIPTSKSVEDGEFWIEVSADNSIRILINDGGIEAYPTPAGALID
ncbi:prepilin-type N-terminal cleavage/methylation domain-containing protein [Clostridium vincentii]|uniref:Type II secretion system protein G n=1 Tax=Clostridium vincentii TaxID=52704 RepID=A0A2T0BC85_9CLOT|nr:prepilin-type N-terminal cleavage/methylation domain-containing protein [Clostridium vincentii]PRR81452.1 Type II secretion system protein G precursor [Clostridium vincentii]